MKALVAAAVACALIGSGALAAGSASEPDADAAARQQVLVMLNIPAPHFRADGNYSTGYADASGSAARRRVAADLARTHGLALVTGWPMPILGLDCYVLQVPAGSRPEDVAESLGRDERVAWAQAMNVFRTLGHDDPLFAMQPAAREWRLDQLHATTTGRDIRVAVIDSGVQLDHPDLVDQISASANFVARSDFAAESHGTAVAGIIAARADNEVGIAGVAPQARLLALRACRQSTPTDTVCTSLSLALALQSAIERGAQVVNLSLGGPHDRLLQQFVDAALARGIGVVAAADAALPQGGFPAGLPGVVAVLDEASAAVPFTAVRAPGTDVPATLPGSRWAMVSGSSYAAAHVSGLLALMLEARGRTKGNRAPIGNDLVLGADGRIDICASLQRAGGTCGAVAPIASVARP